MKQDQLTRKDLEEIGVDLNDEKFELMKTYYMATGDSKEAFLKYCSLDLRDGNNEFVDYLINTLTARVFELQRTIAVNEVRDKDTFDSLVYVVDKLNKIKKECVPHAVLTLADRGLNTLEGVLEGYGSKLDTIIKKAKMHVDLTTDEIAYLVEIEKNNRN